jgi:hypothetical protein
MADEQNPIAYTEQCTCSFVGCQNFRLRSQRKSFGTFVGVGKRHVDIVTDRPAAVCSRLHS